MAALGSALRALPLLCIWAAAAWPFVLWLVHQGDPEAAVALAQGLAHLAMQTAWSSLLVGALLLLMFPPAPAFVRRAGARIWMRMTFDQGPLLRALGELQHFENGPRHAEVGRLLRLRGDFAAALPHLRTAVELDPSVPGSWHQFGLALFRLRAFPEAAAAFANAEHLDAGHAFGDSVLYLGRALHEIHDPRALPTLQLHRQRHGGGPRSLLWLAEALARAGQHAEARAMLRLAAAPPTVALSAEENWFRALARVRLWGKGGAS